MIDLIFNSEYGKLEVDWTVLTQNTEERVICQNQLFGIMIHEDVYCSC